jgi:hypothetical protein
MVEIKPPRHVWSVCLYIDTGSGTFAFVDRAPALAIPDEQRVALERWVRAGMTPQRLAFRSRIVLLAATGTPSKHIAAQLDTSQDTTYGVAAPVRDRRAGGDFRGVPDLIDAITGHRSKRQGRQAPAQCGSLAETLLFKPGL